MTLYVTVPAPPQRGMSYIETWIIGMQVPTLVAVLESSWILYMARSGQNKIAMNGREMEKQGSRLKKIDFFTSFFLTVYFILFQMSFWLASLA